MSRTTGILIFFLAALLAGLFVTYASPLPVVAEAKKEKFAQKEVGMPLDTQPVQGYSGSSPILGSEPKPVSEKPYEKADDTELFQFEGNKISADCCPSPFSSDLGCICLTEKQRAEFASRGGNRAS
jgi:hypothetical protein